jgi:hypothetical protein
MIRFEQTFMKFCSNIRKGIAGPTLSDFLEKIGARAAALLLSIMYIST